MVRRSIVFLRFAYLSKLSDGSYYGGVTLCNCITRGAGASTSLTDARFIDSLADG